jgi:hypothetical protein
MESSSGRDKLMPSSVRYILSSTGYVLPSLSGIINYVVAIQFY